MEFDNFVSEQLHGPAGPAIRGLGAAQGHKAGLGLAVEFARLRIRMRLAGEYGVESVHDRTLADALNCPDMGMDGSGYFAVAQRSSGTVFISHEQDGGGAVPVSPNTAFAAERFELLAFFGSESDAV